MKKFMLMLVAALCMMFTNVNAQNATVESSRFFNNTYIGLSVGGQVGMNDIVGHGNWTVAPYGSLYLGKWITPAVGVEVNADVLFHDGFTTRGNVVDATYVGIDGRLNLNNLFRPYTGTPARVEVIPFVGFGWLHGYGHGYVMGERGNVPTADAIGKNAFATKMGIDLVFNIGEARAWAIDVRPTVMYALTGRNTGVHNPIYNVNRGRVGLEVGFTHKFGYKNSKRDRVHNFTKAYTAAEYDNMVTYLSAMKPDTVTVTNEVEVLREKVVEVPVVKPEFILMDPYFAQGKAKIDPTADVILNALAAKMTETGKNYKITGYASVEGVEAFNNQLSLKRAQVVRDALVERGVSADKLTVEGAGSTDQFGESYDLNRRVVITEAN